MFGEAQILLVLDEKCFLKTIESLQRFEIGRKINMVKTTDSGRTTTDVLKHVAGTVKYVLKGVRRDLL